MRKLLPAVAVVAAVLLAALAVSPAVGATTELTNTTVSPDADTESIRVTAENITNDQATVTVYDLATANNSQVSTATLTTDEVNGTYVDTYDFSTLNQSRDYRVVVTGDSADLLDVAKVQVVAAGAGGSGDGSDLPVPAEAAIVGALAVVAAGAAGLSRRD